MSSAFRTRTALGLSAAAHLMLFGALLLTLHGPHASSPLVVRLLEPSSTEGTAPIEARPAPPGTLAPLAVMRKPESLSVRAPVRLVRAQATPTPVKDVMEASTAMAAPEALGNVSVPSAQDGSPSSAPLDAPQAHASSGAGQSGAGPSVSASRLAELHRRLAEAAARCYPAAARRFRLQGEVPVHFCLDPKGIATALALEGSTGSALLDRSALECVVPGAQPLDGFEGCFLVPVHFGT